MKKAGPFCVWEKALAAKSLLEAEPFDIIKGKAGAETTDKEKKDGYGIQ